MPNPNRSILAAVTLFFLAPLVAEFLLGDFPLTWLLLLIVLAPMYGGGALLIRELTRRSGRGWPTILLLGVACAILEEAFTTQSLFNRNYLGMHLLAHAWIPALGIGAWWTLFTLNVHPFWSIGVSIALVEGLYPSRARTPWLGNGGLSVVAALFAIGVCYNTSYSLRHDPFRASPAQFIVAATLVVIFAAAAFLLPASATPRTPGAAPPLPVPSDLIAGIAAFLFGAAIFLAPIQWNWGAVAWILAADLVFLFSLWVFSRRSGWTPLHTLSAGAGGALVYGVHAFTGNPVVPCPKWIALASHVLFLALAIAVVAAAGCRARATLLLGPQQQTPARPL